MVPIDYSKWDNIDTDSEAESAPANTPAVSAALQSGASDSPLAHSASGPIQAVIVRCDVEKRKFVPWSATTIPADHPAFSEPVSPVPRLIEVPLVVYSVGSQSANRADLTERKDALARLAREPSSSFAAQLATTRS